MFARVGLGYGTYSVSIGGLCGYLVMSVGKRRVTYWTEIRGRGIIRKKEMTRCLVQFRYWIGLIVVCMYKLLLEKYFTELRFVVVGRSELAEKLRWLPRSLAVVARTNAQFKFTHPSRSP